MGIRNGGGPVRAIGKSRSDLKKSFKLAVRSLLTTCSSQVISSLHGNVEDEFESLCHETIRTNVMDAVYGLSTAKKTEIHYLRGLLERLRNVSSTAVTESVWNG
ncbi:hypothetical protein V6N13_096386 [Hibiscus sabdariffa]|uniref:Uncharacterized protein n=1 Tax=Hibiscus sabdariffa TaxID=183260 RepID=A0ABR2DFU8_9ROSI